jgi:hypothetical protein
MSLLHTLCGYGWYESLVHTLCAYGWYQRLHHVEVVNMILDIADIVVL